MEILVSTADYEIDWRALVSEKRVARRPQIPVNRNDCITEAMSQGVPLHAIEEYLDWLDTVGDSVPNRGAQNK